jgi:acyl-CoA-binding protein
MLFAGKRHLFLMEASENRDTVAVLNLVSLTTRQFQKTTFSLSSLHEEHSNCELLALFALFAHKKNSAAVDMLNRGQSPVPGSCHYPGGFQF